MRDHHAQMPQVSADRWEQALLTLRLALLWKLSDERWDGVAKTLTCLLDASRAGDDAAFGRAANALRSFGPKRNVSDVDSPTVGPPPPKIRERLNSMIHVLTELSPELLAAPAPSQTPRQP